MAAAGATALVLVAMTAALGASAAQAACPNEAFRTGPSAFLAECRAYEMVTPVDKESAEGILSAAPALVASAGDEIYFNSPSAYAGAQGSFLNNPYLATRGAGAWGVAPIGGLQAAPGGVAHGFLAGVSRDLDLAVLSSEEVLAPGAVQGDSNIYLRDNRTGTYTTIFAQSGIRPTVPSLAGATPGFGVVLLSLPGGIYEFRDGQLRLAVAGGEPAAQSDIGGPPTEATPNLISTDGTSFFYRLGGVLYEHRPDGASALVSEDEEENEAQGQLVGASPDGQVAFFQAGFSGPLYRFDASAPEGERTTDLTPPVEGAASNVYGAVASEDGRTVYFASPALLTNDAEPLEKNQFGAPEGYDLYVWHEDQGRPGALRYIGQSRVGGENGPLAALVSLDGRYLGFESFGQVTSDAIDGSAESCPSSSRQNPSGRCSNVFVYDRDTGRLACATCAGSPPAGDSRLGGAVRGNPRPYNTVRAVLENGTVLFDTPNRLVPRDVDGVRDAYSWREGTAQLISSGTSPSASDFVAASEDGSNLFFSTTQRLVGQDTDSTADLYDARVEGGLPQEGSEATPVCADEAACRGAAVIGSSSPPTPGSLTVRGARNLPSTCTGARAKARAAKRRRRTLARRAAHAKGARAKRLRGAVRRETKLAERLGRKATSCKGAGR